MDSKQIPPRISIFDKKGQANLNRFAVKTEAPKNTTKVSVPVVRINQHKGA